jgi:hypothetical protein
MSFRWSHWGQCSGNSGATREQLAEYSAAQVQGQSAQAEQAAVRAGTEGVRSLTNNNLLTLVNNWESGQSGGLRQPELKV